MDIKLGEEEISKIRKMIRKEILNSIRIGEEKLIEQVKEDEISSFRS